MIENVLQAQKGACQQKIQLSNVEKEIFKISSQFLTNNRKRRNKVFSKCNFWTRMKRFLDLSILRRCTDKSMSFYIPCATGRYFFRPPQFGNKHRYNAAECTSQLTWSKSKSYVLLDNLWVRWMGNLVLLVTMMCSWKVNSWQQNEKGEICSINLTKTLFLPDTHSTNGHFSIKFHDLKRL